MARSRAASALGVALALGECDAADAERGLMGARDVWSAVASVSSGAELSDCQVLVLANRGTGGRLRARRTVMRDAMDAEPVQQLLRTVAEEGGRVIQLFAKAEADPSGQIRGRRHTMLTDSDLQSTRHARAAVGGLLAGLVGDPCIYVSGGAEHQGPVGGGPVTVIYEVTV
jgi:cyanuric acid amidohydrolase